MLLPSPQARRDPTHRSLSPGAGDPAASLLIRDPSPVSGDPSPSMPGTRCDDSTCTVVVRRDLPVGPVHTGRVSRFAGKFAACVNRALEIGGGCRQDRRRSRIVLQRGGPRPGVL